MSARSLDAHVEAAVLARDGRRRGKEIRFRCPTHPDEHPSADYNRARAVWICRSCGAGGGLRDLARRLGLSADPSPFARPRRLSAEEALVRQEGRRQTRLARFRPILALSDEIKETRRAAEVMRVLVSRGSVDEEATWDLAFVMAEFQREADWLEAEQDELMRAMR